MQHLHTALLLRQIRLSEGWSYQELAARLGVDASTVQRFIEQPQRRVYDTTVYKITRFLEARRPPPKRRRRRTRAGNGRAA